MFTAPLRCSVCFTPLTAGDASACLLCRLMPLPFGALRYAWNYEREARCLIHVMKYRPSPRLCGIAGRLLAASLPALQLPARYDLLVPMASARGSLRTRGFNQCLLIAAELARALPGARLTPQALVHVKAGKPQASLPHHLRLRNVRGCFTARPGLVGGRCVLLLDDVLTTGATSSAAAGALLAAGACRVDLLALARSPAWTSFRHDVRRAYARGALITEPCHGSCGAPGSR